MGNTIRRKPVTVSIPSSPDYKYLNITNFGGLEVSDNPFVVSNNSAKEMLNVYVDETNTLTTRPRLKFDDIVYAEQDSKIYENKVEFFENGVSVIYEAIEINGKAAIKRTSGENINSTSLLVGEESISLNNVYFYKVSTDRCYVYALKRPNESYGGYVFEIRYVSSALGLLSQFIEETYKSLNDTLDLLLVSSKEFAEKGRSLYYDSDGFFVWQDNFNNEIVINTIDTRGRYVGPYKIQTRSIQPKSKKYLCFEHKDVIYFMGNGEYFGYNVVTNKFEKVFGYVPTVNVDSSNILTNRGIIEYPRDVKTLIEQDLSNVTFDAEKTEETLDISSDGYEIVGYAEKADMFLLRKKIENDTHFIRYDFYLAKRQSNDFEILKKLDLPEPLTKREQKNKISCSISSDATSIVYAANIFNNTTYEYEGKCYVGILDNTYNVNWTLAYTANWGDFASNIGNRFFISNGGDIVYTYSVKTLSTIIYKISKQSDNSYVMRPITPQSYTNSTDSAYSGNNSIQFSSNGQVIVFYLDGGQHAGRGTYKISYSFNAGDTFTKDVEYTIYGTDNFQISDDGRTVLMGNTIIKDLLEAPTETVTINNFSVYDVLFKNEKFLYSPTNNQLYDIKNEKYFSTNNVARFTTNINRQYLWETLAQINVETLSIKYVVISNEAGDFKTVIRTITVDKVYKNTNTVTNVDVSDLFNPKIIAKFDNNYWFFTENKIYKTVNNDPTYIPVDLITDVGNTSPFTGVNVISDTVMVVYTKDKLYAITDASTSENDYDYTVTETKQTVGNTPLNAPIISAYNELVLQFNKDGVYALRTLENVQSTERIAEMISDKITPLWEKESDYIDNLITVKRLYWTYVIIPHETETHIYLYDGRTNDWFYWELPILVKFVYEKDNKVYVIDYKNQMYSLEKDEATTMLTENTQFTEYYDEVDDEHKLIKWFWKSQILPLGTINYAKRIVSTTFILTDTDSLDKYGLNYKFTAYKKNVTSTPDSTIVNNIVYVQSVTKKTVLPRVNFIQITLSNIPEEDENAYDTNKLRLTGLGVKYVLLSGGMN